MERREDVSISVSEQEVAQIASLARLRLDASACAQMAVELTRILGLFERLSELDLDSMPPMSHVTEGGTPLREDRARVSDERDAALAAAPALAGGHVRVPKVV